MVREQSFNALFRIGGTLTAAFFLGGGLFAAVMTPLTYYGVRALVVHRRARREKARDTQA